MFRAQYLLVFIFPLCAFAQKNSFNLCFSAGPNYIFNAPSANYNVGISETIGVNYLAHKKGGAFSFKPELFLMLSDFNSKMQLYDGIARISQRSVGLTLDVLLRIGKRNYLKTGLFFQNHLLSNIEVIYRKNLSNYYAFGNNQLYVPYSPQEFQAGVSLGYVFPFRIKKTEMRFNINVLHYANSILRNEYKIPGYNGKNGEALFSAKIMPTLLLLGFEISLKKKSKERSVPSDE